MLCASDTWINERQCDGMSVFTCARALSHTPHLHQNREKKKKTNYNEHTDISNIIQNDNEKETADPYYPELCTQSFLRSCHAFVASVHLCLFAEEKKKKNKENTLPLDVRCASQFHTECCVCVCGSCVVYPINLVGTGKTIHMPYAKRKINLFCCDRN